MNKSDGLNFNKAIQMLIFNGNPNGLIMCELSNWNGRVYKFTRNELMGFSNREDSINTGVYLLLGKDDNNKDEVYIGESESLRKRIYQHLEKDFWNTCIVITTKDNYLNKAHVKYLEHEFFLLAKASTSSSLKNNNEPTRSSISEYDESMLLEFISNSKLLVNSLGYKVFESYEDIVIKSENKNIDFFIKGPRNSCATGNSTITGFLVLKDSIIEQQVQVSMTESLQKRRQYLLDSGVIDSNYKFVKDYLFTSPSLAAAIVLGRNSNGRTEWKTQDKVTLKDIEKHSSNSELTSLEGE